MPQYDGPIDDPALYFNRELSWLDFNQRVLELAEEHEVPLLERVRFCAIYASNLDEFFMVRVAGLFDQLDAGIDARGPDGLAPGEQIDAIQARVLELDRRLHACFDGDAAPGAGGARDPDRLAGDRERGGAARDRPALPRAGLPGADPAGDRPRPSLPLHLQPLAQPRRAVARPRERGTRSSPGSRCRRSCSAASCRSGEDGKAFVPLEEVIAANLDVLFPGTEVVDYGYFRVTRDADFTVTDEADDLLQAVQDEICAAAASARSCGWRSRPG